MEFHFHVFVFENVDLFARDDSVSQEETSDVHGPAISAFWNTCDKQLISKMGVSETGYWYMYMNTSHQMTIVKIRENDHETRSAYLHRSFLLYYNNFQIQGTPEVGCI